MSIFAGGCTLQAAETVCGTELQIDVLDGMASLVDKNLLRQEENELDEPRFYMLETIREFASEQLENSPEKDSLQIAPATYFLALVEEAKQDYFGSASQGLEKIEMERHNLRAAVDWSIKNDIEMAAKLVIKMSDFWSLRNRQEGIHQSARIIEHIDRLPINLQLRILLKWLSFSYMHDDSEMLNEPCEKAIKLSRETNEQGALQLALRIKGSLALKRGKFHSALGCFEEALKVARQMKPPRLSSAASLNAIAFSTMALSTTHHFCLLNFKEAKRYYLEALPLFEQSNYKCGSAIVYSRLALLEAYEGNIVESRDLYIKASQILNKDIDVAGFAWCQLGLGELCLMENDSKGARAYLMESLRAFHEQGVTDRIPDVLALLALLAAAHLQWTRAAILCGAQETSEYAMRIPGSKRHIEHVTKNATTALSESTFNAELANGRAMTLDQAVEYALAEDVNGE